jgi:hypothetical protein
MFVNRNCLKQAGCHFTKSPRLSKHKATEMPVSPGKLLQISYNSFRPQRCPAVFICSYWMDLASLMI